MFKTYFWQKLLSFWKIPHKNHLIRKRYLHLYKCFEINEIYYNIKKLADELKISGYARNVDDDKLEAVFEGDVKSVESLVEFCKEGPENAEVSAIIVDEQNYKGEFRNFSVIE